MYFRCFVLSFIFIFFIVLAGCNTSEENSAIKTARGYKTKEFNIDLLNASSPEGIEKQMQSTESYLSEEYYLKQYDSKNIALPLQIAKKEQASLSTKDLKLKVKKNNGENITLDYRLRLQLEYKEAHKVDKIDIKGVLTLEEINGTWLIKNDEYNIKDLKNLLTSK